MEKQRTTPSQISGYLSSLLRKHFGKGPLATYVTIEAPYMIINLDGFLSSSEAILFKKGEGQRIAETRDLLFDELKPEIMLELSNLSGHLVKELYADWNLSNQTAAIIAVLDEESPGFEMAWPDDIDSEAFTGGIIKASKKAQRIPDVTEIFWLSDKVVVIKRPLEYRMIKESNLDPALKARIINIFVDWNFESDKGYMALVFKT